MNHLKVTCWGNLDSHSPSCHCSFRFVRAAFARLLASPRSRTLSRWAGREGKPGLRVMRLSALALNAVPWKRNESSNIFKLPKTVPISNVLSCFSRRMGKTRISFLFLFKKIWSPVCRFHHTYTLKEQNTFPLQVITTRTFFRTARSRQATPMI